MPGTGSAGGPLECILTGAGVLADLGARIEDPATRAVVVDWLPAAAAPAGGPWPGYWRVVFPVAPAAGVYLLVWRTEMDPPLVEIIDSVSISGEGIGPQGWLPGVQDVADVAHQYTRAPFTSALDQAGAPRGVFDDSTVPTAAEVDRLITAAGHEVQGRVGFAIPPRCHDLARRTVVWRVAMVLAQRAMPGFTEASDGEYQANIGNYLKCLDELVTQARSGPVRLQ